MKWRIVDPCPVERADGQLCSGERGHELPHSGSVWKRGEIVGGVFWGDDGVDVEPPPPWS